MQLIREKKDEWKLNKIQNALLCILYDLDYFCSVNEIDYFLIDGSALGAIRHKGFIPWDDDIDIGMTVAQYKKFRRLYWEKYDKNTYYLQEFGFCNGMITRAKIRKNGTYIKEDIDRYKQRDSHMGLSIDIFIFHEAPENVIQRHWQHLWGRYLRYKRTVNTAFSKGNKFSFLLKILSKFPKMILVNYALKQQYKWDGKNTKNYFSSFYAEKGFKRALYKKEWFKEIVRVPFELIKLPVCVGIEEYLKCMYGDYMKTPTNEQILRGQHAVEFSEEIDFHEIFPYVECYKDDIWTL